MRFTTILRIRNTWPQFVSQQQQYVPKHNPVAEEDVMRLQEFLMSKPNILVLTGAGISTESGNFSIDFIFRIYLNVIIFRYS